MKIKGLKNITYITTIKNTKAENIISSENIVMK
jgi:hypothetical protein